MRIILAILLLLCGNSFAQENIAEFSDKTVPVLNDSLKSLNDNANKSKNRLDSYFGSTGILSVSAGGTGQDFSSASEDSLVYFDATGQMGTVGVGTTGQYFKSLGQGNGYTWSAITQPGLVFVSATTLSSETTKTITGLEVGIPYKLVLNLTASGAAEHLLLYTNGTLSTIKVTTGYDGGSEKLSLNNTTTTFNTASPTTGSWNIDVMTLRGDGTKTGIIVKGFDVENDGTFNENTAYAIVDSDANLSSITIESSGGTMTLTGTAYLYKYSTT